MSIDFIFRILGMAVFSFWGSIWGANIVTSRETSTYYFPVLLGLLGALIGLVLTPYLTVRPVRVIRGYLTQISARTLFAGLLGLTMSLIVSALISFPLSLLPEPFGEVFPVGFAILFSYFGITIFMHRQNDLFQIWGALASGVSSSEKDMDGGALVTILLDTSVIIDGRVADIARSGFIPGELVITRFVLNELQFIADSSDNLRRQRGRRGLEVLSVLQKDPEIPVRISDMDVEGAKAVDDKLVILARQIRGRILTNDYNLNRVAELQGVNVLNINELANAVKTVFLPGEALQVKIIQEGREAGQGIGYLDDGTMVVVQGGNNYIGVDLDTVVTKVLQTAAGRMVFSRPEVE